MYTSDLDGVSESLVQRGSGVGFGRFFLEDMKREVFEFSLDLDPFPFPVPNKAFVLELPPVARNASFLGAGEVGSLVYERQITIDDGPEFFAWSVVATEQMQVGFHVVRVQEIASLPQFRRH